MKQNKTVNYNYLLRCYIESEMFQLNLQQTYYLRPVPIQKNVFTKSQKVKRRKKIILT